MMETLMGVVIGGIIASIAPVATLLVQHRRWKWEAKLEYLRAERRRLEDLYARTLDELSKAMAENSYPSHMTSDILILMPKAVADCFDTWMAEKDKDNTKAKHVYMNICVEMKRSLADIDQSIRKLIDS